MVHNFGTFDMSGEIIPREDIHYGFWSRMIERCYSVKELQRHPQYSEITVCDEWSLFSNFYEWSVQNHKEGYELDKDLSVINSKQYSPENCAYVPQELNKCLAENTQRRGLFPLGVWYKQRSKGMINERSKPYIAQFNKIKIGHFSTSLDAHREWQLSKINHIENLIAIYTPFVDQKVITGLDLRIKMLKQDYSNNSITETLK